MRTTLDALLVLLAVGWFLALGVVVVFLMGVGDRADQPFLDELRAAHENDYRSRHK